MNRDAISYYQSASSVMEEFCRPLNDYFSIPLFVYFKVYRDGSYIFLSNNIKTTKEYCSKITHDLIYFHNYLENNQNRNLILWPGNPTNRGMQLILNEGHWHGLNVVTQQNSNSIECCCFVSNRDNPQINELFIRHYNVLEKFAAHFKFINADIIDVSNQYRAKYKSYDFYLPEHQITNSKNTQKFLQTLGIDRGVLDTDGKFIKLTPRELECLKLINNGLSLKGIGNKLLLSPRTIEAHLNNIKHKTGYNSKNELIKLCRDSFEGDL